MIIFFIYRYIFWIFCIWGCLGHLLNIYVFTRSCFRSNPASFYFVASTLANLILVCIFIPIKILRFGFNIDPTSSSLVFCKLYFFSEDSIRMFVSWFLTLACIDRYCFTSSNIGLRQLSTMINIRFILSFSAIMILFINIHLVLFYQIAFHQCIPLLGIYERFLVRYRLVINFLLPTFFMSICGILILKNISQSKRQISPFMIEMIYNHRIIRNKRQINNQIYRMLFTQCTIWFLMNLLAFIHEIFLWIIYCLTFIVFLLSSRLFRRQVIQFLHKHS